MGSGPHATAPRRPLRARWMRLAQSAAQVQSNVLLWLVYFLLWVPLGLVRRPFTSWGRRREVPGWIERPPADSSLEAVRRQF